MQTRPYPEKDGVRIWLSRSERQRLLDVVEEQPRRRIAFELALHGLRTDEIVADEDSKGPGVQPRHVRQLANGADGCVLIIPDGKTGKRETPISPDLARQIRYLKRAAQMRLDEPVVHVGKRQVRNWIEDARDQVRSLDDAESYWPLLGMHDLRRTWATDSYYSLAFRGVPIAEQLTMSWGGWAQTESGRETFRENYLGPVPDHVTAQAVEHLGLV